MVFSTFHTGRMGVNELLALLFPAKTGGGGGGHREMDAGSQDGTPLTATYCSGISGMVRPRWSRKHGLVNPSLLARKSRTVAPTKSRRLGFATRAAAAGLWFCTAM